MSRANVVCRNSPAYSFLLVQALLQSLNATSTTSVLRCRLHRHSHQEDRERDGITRRLVSLDSDGARALDLPRMLSLDGVARRLAQATSRSLPTIRQKRKQKMGTIMMMVTILALKMTVTTPPWSRIQKHSLHYTPVQSHTLH